MVKYVVILFYEINKITETKVFGPFNSPSDAETWSESRKFHLSNDYIECQIRPVFSPSN